MNKIVSVKMLFWWIHLSATAGLFWACQQQPCATPLDCSVGAQCVAGQCVEGVRAEHSERRPEVEALCAPPQLGQLVLNEILADPSGRDINGDGVVDPFEDEFIEIVNVATYPVNLAEVYIRVGSASRFVFPPTCLEPGLSTLVFGGGHPAQTAAQMTFVADESLRLANSGTSVALVRTDDLVLDLLVYGDEADGPYSLTRSPDAIGDWRVHPERDTVSGVSHSAGLCINGNVFPGCSPQTSERLLDDPPIRAGCPLAVSGDLVINEFMADPGGFDANGDGFSQWRQDEFVEVILVANSERDLSGVSLHINGYLKYTFTSGCHAAGQVYLIFGGGNPDLALGDNVLVTVSDTALQLSNSGGGLALRRGDETLHVVGYGAEGGKDQSLTRFPDITGDFVAHRQTPSGLQASPGLCASGMTFKEGCSGDR